MQNSKPKLKQRAYLYALGVIKFIDYLEKKDFSVQVLSKQLLRSATSIGANIIEAQAASSKKDFTKFFNYALKSATQALVQSRRRSGASLINESKFWISLLRDSKKANKEKADNLLQETTELANILGSSILTLRGKNKL